MIELFNQSYILKAALILAIISIPAGAIGCLLIWRRMVFLGDSIAHSSLLGVSLGLIFQLSITYSIIATCLIFAVVFSSLRNQSRLPTDTALNIIAYVALSAGILIISLDPSLIFNLHQLMFGSIFFLSPTDIGLVALVSLSIAVYLYRLWPKIVISILQPTLASAEGIAVKRLRFSLTLLTSVLIAITVQIFGILLITSLMVIPAAIAKQFAQTPLQMAVMASLLSLLGGLLGLIAGVLLDLPVTPSIITSLGLLLAIALIARPR